MAGLNRRDFLKALGLGSTASAAAGCGFDQNYYRQPIEQVLPYLVRPEQVIPGTPAFFATTLTTGPKAHPVLARHRDGRVINVGANPRATSKGVPRAALLELQRHYSPDRPKAPRVDAAESGWDEALQVVAGAVKAARDGGKKVAYLGPNRSGSIVALLAEFTGGNAVYWEPAGHEAEALAAEKLFGQRALPAYDLSKAHYVLSFGADFLGTWGGPNLEWQYAKARNPNEGNFVARFALVSPHRGQTGANADDWYAAIPGSEAQVALAVAKLVADRVGYSGPLTGILGQANVDGAASASGLKKEDLEAIAAEFAAGAAVALPGGTVGASAAATDLAIATYVLNLVSGNGGITFGVGPVYAGPIDPIARVEQLIAEMNAGDIAVLFVDDVNPVYSLPGSGFAEALGKVGMTVSVNPHGDETAAACKVHLPCADMLEDWGDEEPAAGLHLLRQPSMTPLHDSRSFGDVVLATARAAGMGQTETGAGPAGAAPPVEGQAATAGFSATNWREYVKARWQRDVFGAAGASGSFEDFWHGALEAGFVDLDTKLVPPGVAGGEITIGAAAAPSGSGDVALVVYPHPFRQDGRYANEPWAQEVPDPMTGHVWDSWVEIHPTTADGLGIAENDLVEVTTEAGKVSLGAHRYLGVAPGVVAIAFGQGHAAAKGRYAEGFGVNAFSLVKIVKDASGAMVWQQAKASVAKTGGKADLVSTFGSNTENDRDFGVVVKADELAKVGDAPAEHAGQLTNIHHLELDERLQKAGISDFYGLPDHPTYRFGMAIDVNACNGCGVCAIACYAENNLPVVGKQKVYEGREMGWLRINRYWSEDDGNGPNEIRFVPMLCQHCGHAPCESVCPVLATYHTIDGLNAMVYNRCVGTRYCSNNCPYKVRRFNWHSYVWPEPFNLQLNPDVSSRTMGVMEKCTFCVQRIRAVKSAYKNSDGFTAVVPDAALKNLPACVEACPSSALTFGNLNDPESTPSKTRKSGRTYEILADLNVFSAINYLGKASFHYVERHGEGHADASGHAEGGHEAAPAEGEAHTPAEAPAEHH